MQTKTNDDKIRTQKTTHAPEKTGTQAAEFLTNLCESGAMLPSHLAVRLQQTPVATGVALGLPSLQPLDNEEDKCSFCRRK